MAEERSSAFMLSDGWYNFLKRLVQIIIPAFGTFYVTMAGIWDLPHADKVAGTCLAISLFLGVCLGISNAQYNASGAAFDGKVMVQRQGPGDNAPLAVVGVHTDGDAKQIQEKAAIKLKVEEVLPLAEEPTFDDEDDEPEVPPMNPATDTRRRTKAAKATKKQE